MVKVLFICSGNSCRSQMAEGLARKLKHGLIEPYSAGIELHRLHPDAVRVMAEIGIDISSQRSKTVNDLRGIKFDYVVTLSERARQLCPKFWKKARMLHRSLESPPRLASAATNEEERLTPYRQVRDTIHRIVDSLSEPIRFR